MPLQTEKQFSGIYDRYFEELCRFLTYYSLDGHLIEEVVQDVFMKLWEERTNLEVNHIKTYLYRSARNRILNVLRDRRNREVLLSNWAREESLYREGVDCIDRNRFLHHLNQAIDGLPERCKEIFTLKHEAKLSYLEISVIQQVTLKTVENQMGTALRRIREYMLSVDRKWEE